jgi:pimeloyl-ACP methyl ester carboxylesterase
MASRFAPLLSAVLVATALAAIPVPLEAARECEDLSYRSQIGYCAHLPTADLFYSDTHPDPGTRRALKGTVIFLHAATGNADAFTYQFAAFAKAGYRAIAYDRKNVGRSSNTLRDAALGRPIGTTVQDLDALATYVGVERFHLVAVAAGAQLALGYAAWKPERLLSLVIAATLGTVGGPNGEADVTQFQANIAMPFEVFCPGSAAGVAAPLLDPGTTKIPDVRAEHRELGAAFRGRDRSGVAFYHSIEENSRQRRIEGCRTIPIGPNQPGVQAVNPDIVPSSYARLQRVRVRTLLVGGGGDILSPPYGMRLWGAHLPNARWALIPEAGHAPQIEDPNLFNAEVLRFISGSERFPRIVNFR